MDAEGSKAEFIRLSANWQFKKDPAGIGEKEKWVEGESAVGWSLYRTDLGVGWEQQGHSNAVGMGWCKKSITIPEKIDGKRLYLFFEACDEDAWMWIDG